jgi:WD40 repeat protein
MSTSPPDAPASESLLSPEAPYRGLTSYSEQDAPLFFGRETECDLIIANMMASRLTLLYGASGVGKTSLLRAGVTHELRTSSGRNLADYGAPELVAVYFNQWPGNPLAALTRRIQESARPFLRGLDEPQIEPAGLAETLHGWSTTLDADLLIILDQFEEYFLYHADDQGAGSFAAEFVDAVNRTGVRASFLVAIREDALARLDRFKGRLPSLFDNYLRTRHLDVDAARAAIERPLEAYNRLVPSEEPFRAEPELVQMVLEQVQIGKVTLGATGRGIIERDSGPDDADQRIETPYLQLVLTRLWREEVAAGSHTLRAETLRRLGGAQQIVRTHLDEALSTLPARQQDVAAAIFHHLVTPSGTKIAHTAPDLADYAQLPEAEVTSVLQDLSRGEVRILRPVPPPSGERNDHPPYEIFHDVLATAILNWRTRHTEARAAEARLAPRLERSVQETRAAEKRARHYRRWLTRMTVIAMALLLALTSVVAVLATRGRDAAVKAQSSSRSRELASQALTQIGVNPNSSRRLALAALDESPTAEAESALRRTLSEPQARVLSGHGDWVIGASFNPNGPFLLTAGFDSTLRVWSTATGKQLAMLRTGAPPYHYSGRPEFSPDGKRVLVITRDGEVSVWRWRTGDPPTVVSRGQEAVRAVFSPDGRRVITGHRDGTTRVWAWQTARPLRVLPRSGEDSIVALAVSPDGRFVATGGDLGTVRLWRWEAAGPAVKLAGHTQYVNTVAFSPDSDLVATASDDLTARVSSVHGRAVAVLRGHTAEVNSAAFSPDSRLLVTASVDKTARVFSARSGKTVAVLRGHADALQEAVFGPDGRVVATASDDGSAALWPVETRGAPVRLLGHAGRLFTVAFSPDGGTVATSSADGTARLWGVVPRRVFGGHTAPVNGAVFSPNGRLVATAGEDGVARLHRAADGGEVGVLREPDGALDSVAFSPEGRRLVTAGLSAEGEGVVRIWELDALGRSRVIARDPEEITTAEFSPEGRRVIITTQHKVTIWNVRTGRRLITIKLPKARVEANPFVQFIGANFSRDGRSVLTAHYDKTARIWNATNGRLIRVLQGHTGTVYSAAYSTDGSQVVTASGDGTTRVWDAATGRQLHVLVGPAGQLRSAAFSPDRQWVAAGAVDGTVQIWGVQSQQLAAVLRPHADLVTSVAWSPDGKSILSGSDDNTAEITSCTSCRPLAELLVVARQSEGTATSHP